MKNPFSQHSLFLREFWSNYHTTGAVLPSGSFLGRALARFVREPADRPRRILEVGPGTGAVTTHIIRAMGEDDRLDLVELNDSFVAGLRSRFEHDPTYRPVADRAKIHHCAIQDIEAEEPYDAIVSGLPLNNFSAELVEQILATMTGLLRSGGTLSFFEYIAIRTVKGFVCGREDRERLRGIAQVMGALLKEHEIRRDAVWPNVPPAWVHHVRV